MLLMFLFLLIVPSATAHSVRHVCCGCGDDSSPTPWHRATPLNTLNTIDPSATEVFLSGTCKPPVGGTVRGGASPATRVTWRSYPGETPAVISGGVPFTADALHPVTDPAVLAQMSSDAARQNIRQMDLEEVDLGTPKCHPYMGGEASILPGNLVASALEVFMYGDPTVGGALSPLTLARWPNRDHLPQQWASGSVAGYTITVDAGTRSRLPFWRQQLSEAPTGMFAHYLGGYGWNDHHNAIENLTATTLTLTACPSHYSGTPGFDTLDNKGTFYAYGILYELDSEGEYYINYTSRTLYVWPPSGPASAYWGTSPWGKPVVPAQWPTVSLLTRHNTTKVLGEFSVAFNIFEFRSTAFLTLEGIVMTTARNAAIVAVNTTSIIVKNCILQNTGNMVVNASGGAGFTLLNSIVRHGGNGAVFFYAGDRQDLTPGGHAIVGSQVSYSNRYMYCYVPMVALADCGNSIVRSELFGGPHQGVFISGNDHNVTDSLLHDLVEAASDSGTIYMGRDWTYRGNVITNNTFLRINTADAGDDVSAVYLDDMVSGFTVTNNVFVNVSRALLLGGGRDNIFSGNSISGVEGTDGAVHFDNRGMTWMGIAELTRFLQRVPYNTSAVWISKYPHLPNILNDDPSHPKYNEVSHNTYCRCVTFLDQSNATIQSWGSVAFDNTEC